MFFGFDNNQKRKDIDMDMPITDKDLYRHTGFVSIYVCMTRRCNLTCKYCYNQINRRDYLKHFKITAVQSRRIVEEVNECSFVHPFYDLSGGELMLVSDWYESLKVFLSTGREVLINTNGTLINEEVVNLLVTLDRDHPNQLFLSVSLDSHDPEINLKSRSGVASNNVFTAMNLLHKYGLHFRVAITLTTINRPTIVETVRFIVKNYTREFIIGALRPVFPMTSENLLLLVPLSDVQNTKVEILKLQEELGPFTMYHTLDSSGQAFCMAGLDRLNIEPNGDVTACYTLQGADNVVGNIFKEPLCEIVKRLRIANFSRDIRYLLCEHQSKYWGEVPINLKLGLSIKTP